MTYLLAKYTVLFLLTALLGFVLGYWFSRRKFVDVSESYVDLRKANARSDSLQWDQLWQRLDSIPEPKETDLQPLVERLDNLDRGVKAIPIPEKPAPVNFMPVTSKLDNLEQVVRNIPKPVPQRDIDLLPVQNELTSIRSALKAMPAVERHAPVDLRPVTSQLNSLEQKFRAIPRPQNVDMAPIDRRLTAIEVKLGNLDKRLAKPATTERAPRMAAPRKTATRTEPRILSAALYGKKDNLKLISGVGPKLERLLNKNGVFYFWQVADWSSRDINVIDERLDAFKGRIARDHWVNQAKKLRRKPDAASMPAR